MNSPSPYLCHLRLLPGTMWECKFSWHDCSWKINFKSIYDSIHGNHKSNSHALISLPESMLPSNPGIETSPCDFLAQSRPTDALQNSNIFQGMFATHSLKKENLPHIHAVAQYHSCIQGRFLIGIPQARLLLSQRKQNETKSLENQLFWIHRYFIKNFFPFFSSAVYTQLTSTEGRIQPLSTHPSQHQWEMLPATAVLGAMGQRWRGGGRALAEDKIYFWCL